MGPIAGLAAGLGLAALFSSLGIGEEMASLFLVALLGVAAFALFRWMTRPTAQLAPAGATGRMAMASVPASAATPAAAARPDFDEAGFLRQAKLNFVRLHVITSYSIHYTKLYEKHRKRCEFHDLPTMSARKRERVITSYSIHYTKLYEITYKPL